MFCSSNAIVAKPVDHWVHGGEFVIVDATALRPIEYCLLRPSCVSVMMVVPTYRFLTRLNGFHFEECQNYCHCYLLKLTAAVVVARDVDSLLPQVLLLSETFQGKPGI